MRTKSEIGNTEWFGRLPNGWEMKPLKSLFSVRKGITVTKADLVESGTPVVNYGQVHSKLNDGISIRRDLIRHVSPDLLSDKAAPIGKGAFIFASTSEDLAGCGNCIYIDKEIEVYAGGDTTQLVPLQDSDNKYFAYLFSTDNWRFQLRRNLVDVKVFHVNPSDLKESYVVVPPRDVQDSIVTFLDSHCKPIDEAIDRHRSIIGKLEDYRRAVITKAVTKGLDDTATMKDSGIEWIGQIPEKWQISRIKFVAKLASGGTPSREHAEYWNGCIPWVKTGELNDGYITDIEERITEQGLDNSSAKVFPAGTLLMAMYGQGKTRGMTGCLTRDSAINQTCVAFTNLSGVLKDYLWMALRAIYVPVREAAVGSGQPNLSSSLISNFFIPVPPYDEQADISAYLGYKYAAIDEGINRQEQAIAKLEEYRRSLIFHAVTGRIDCTGGVR